MATNQTDTASYYKWLERFADLNITLFEATGLLHGGAKFFDSEDGDVRISVIRRYLHFADEFSENGPMQEWNADEFKTKARSVLVSRFFKISGPWYDWYYWKDLCDPMTNLLRQDLLCFLCCARVAITKGKNFWEWNYYFRDGNITNQEKDYREDCVISDFFCTLVMIVLGDPQPPHQNESIYRLKEQLGGAYHDIILAEAFIRAPWILLTYDLPAGDVAFLEKLHVDVPETFPRVFNVGIQGMPYRALTTQSETLAVLKSRLVAKVL